MMSFNPKDHMTDLRGRDYLEVKWRLVWFREDHPAGLIDTEIVNAENLTIRASIFDGEGNKLATGHGSANADGKRVVWSGREIEKAETAAIGRALAHAGYGTQFTGEDEGEHLADAPVEPTPAKKPAAPPKNGKPQADTKPPHKLKPALIKWMVSQKMAENGHNAAAVYDLLNQDGAIDALLDKDDRDAVKAAVKLYREWRETTDAKPEVAVTHALAGNAPS